MNPVAGLVDVADILLAEKNRLDRAIAALLVCDACLGCILWGTRKSSLATRRLTTVPYRHSNLGLPPGAVARSQTRQNEEQLFGAAGADHGHR